MTPGTEELPSYRRRGDEDESPPSMRGVRVEE